MLLGIEEKLFSAIYIRDQKNAIAILDEIKQINLKIDKSNLLNSIRKPSIEIKNIHGYTPLIESINKGDFKITEALLQSSADIENRADNLSTPIMFAAQSGSVECVQVLIKAKANLNQKGYLQKTALMFAAESGKHHSLKKLLDNKADVNIQDANNQSALMLAVQKGSFTCVTMLLNAGANKDLKDNKGMQASDYALRERHFDCHDILTHSHYLLPSEYQIFKAICLNDLELLKKTITEMDEIHAESKRNPLFIEQAMVPSINVQNRKGHTPLILAAALGHEDCLSELLNHPGLDFNNKKESPLMGAVLGGYEKCAELLLATNKMDVNFRDPALGVTPLMWAAYLGNENMLRLLLTQKDIQLNFVKNLRSSTSNHYTALHFAAEKGHGKICALLIGAGADYSLKTKNLHQKAEYFATKSGCGDIFRAAVFKKEKELEEKKKSKSQKSSFSKAFFSIFPSTKSKYSSVRTHSDSELDKELDKLIP